MQTEEIIEKLKSMGNPVYSDSNNKLGIEGVKVLGVGVTKIKKLAKEIKKNHELALKLWDEPYIETKLLSVFIENPKEVSLEQIKEQIPNSRGFMLADYYAEYITVKTKYTDELIKEWTISGNNHIKKAGYALLYIKAKKDKKADNDFFRPFIPIIENELQDSENWVKESMNYCLMYIGARSKELNQLCLDAAKKIGKVTIDYGETSCMTVDSIKFLKSENVQRKLY